MVTIRKKSKIGVGSRGNLDREDGSRGCYGDGDSQTCVLKGNRSRIMADEVRVRFKYQVLICNTTFIMTLNKCNFI
ncbi:unnamed protein product [Linum tenue]|uniref:Uncharacterized protein n=1 Tax=Linum tenue TaxID=586396 RepID=A0AAV0LBV6_9ROSI|nr:unnamed protein product [Linum tenue]